jgi:hypothetical protein
LHKCLFTADGVACVFFSLHYALWPAGGVGNPPHREVRCAPALPMSRGYSRSA